MRGSILMFLFTVGVSTTIQVVAQDSDNSSTDSRSQQGNLTAPKMPASKAQITLPPTLPMCKQVGQQVTLTLNTGTTPPGSIDPIWTIASPPLLTPFTTSPLFNLGTTARWIQPAAGGTPVGFPLNTYVYSTQFFTPVDPYLYTSIQITETYAADDIPVVKLNGVQIAACSPGVSSTTWCFTSLKSLPSIGWPVFNRLGTAPFLNTLTVEVKNTLPAITSGLLVQARVIAVCSKCSIPPPLPDPPCWPPKTC
jgi:hypothetical protein